MNPALLIFPVLAIAAKNEKVRKLASENARKHSYPSIDEDFLTGILTSNPKAASE